MLLRAGPGEKDYPPGWPSPKARFLLEVQPPKKTVPSPSTKSNWPLVRRKCAERSGKMNAARSTCGGGKRRAEGLFSESRRPGNSSSPGAGLFREGVPEPALCSCCPGTVKAVRGEHPVPGGMLLPGEGAAGLRAGRRDFSGGTKASRNLPSGRSNRARKHPSLSLLCDYFPSLKLCDRFFLLLLSISCCFASLEMGPAGAGLKALCHALFLPPASKDGPSGLSSCKFP